MFKRNGRIILDEQALAKEDMLVVHVKDLTELTLEERWSQVKDEEEWWDEIKPRTLGIVKRLLEDAIESELLNPHTM